MVRTAGLLPFLSIGLMIVGVAARAEESPPDSPPATNQPRLTTTPEGPTAYTLGRGEWEIQLLSWEPFSRYLQKDGNGLSLPMGAVRAAVFEGLMLEAGAGTNSANASFRWRLLELESWPLAIQGRYEFQLVDSHSYSVTTGARSMASVSVMTSLEIDPRRHFHLRIEGGRYHEIASGPAISVQVPVPWSAPAFVSDFVSYGGRFSAEYEHRFGTRHGMSASLAMQVVRGAGNMSETDGTTNSSTAIDLIPVAGLGYYYVREIFWFMCGLELGPTYHLSATETVSGRPEPTSQIVSSLPAIGSALLTIGWRF